MTSNHANSSPRPFSKTRFAALLAAAALLGNSPCAVFAGAASQADIVPDCDNGNTGCQPCPTCPTSCPPGPNGPGTGGNNNDNKNCDGTRINIMASPKGGGTQACGGRSWPLTDFPIGNQDSNAHHSSAAVDGEVNASKGVVQLRRTDFELRGNGDFPISVSRSYDNWTVFNSTNVDGHTVLGPRWHLNYDMAIESASGASDKLLRASFGGMKILYASGTGIWKGNELSGAPCQLTMTASGYTLTQGDPNIVYTFNLDGKLTRIRTHNGNT
jgi:hypothetical protein